MRTLLALAALASTSSLLPGCIPFGCGAYEGRGDTMFRSDKGESVMLCENGGFAATLDKGVVEGVFEWTDAVRASSPDTGARVFTMTTDANGATSSPELGAGWTQATLDKVELDHAHVQCADLETRAWWPTVNATPYLPKAAAFKKVAAGFANVDACYQAQAAGEYPESALCEDELLACPNGRVTLNQGQSVSSGNYSAQFGKLTINPAAGSFFSSFEGVYAAGGTLTVTPAQVWHQVAVTEMSNGATCQ
jgi:hypothetical protein